MEPGQSGLCKGGPLSGALLHVACQGQDALVGEEAANVKGDHEGCRRRFGRVCLRQDYKGWGGCNIVQEAHRNGQAVPCKAAAL